MTALLPDSLAISLGKALGRFLYRKMPSRRDVCLRNLRLCFPDLSENELVEAGKRVFEENGVGAVETSWAWYRDLRHIESKFKIHNSEILIAAERAGGGVLLIGAHYSMLDLITPMIASCIGRFLVSYRPHENWSLEHEIRQRRTRYVDLIDVRSTRKIIRELRSGATVWLAFDQDLGERGSVFAPFFGAPACTVTTPARMVAISGCIPIFVSVHRDGCEYHLAFHSLPENYPNTDQVENAGILNSLLEQALESQPFQYMWMHKRFKTRPNQTKGSFYD